MKKSINEIKIIEEVGKNVGKDLINFMISQRIKEYGENTKDFENNEQESIFFFLKEGEKIKAFGMLKPVIIYCSSREYKIMGLGNMIAIEKSRGYGTILMNHIKAYLRKHNYSCIGNTHKDNFEFYKKCEFLFIPGLVKRFVYIDEQGKQEAKNDWSDYEMFVLDDNNQIQEVINSKSNIFIKVPLW
jgi:hypothetical protein